MHRLKIRELKMLKKNICELGIIHQLGILTQHSLDLTPFNCYPSKMLSSPISDIQTGRKSKYMKPMIVKIQAVNRKNSCTKNSLNKG